MSQELLPCAFCGTDPASFKDYEMAYYFCGCKSCFVRYFSRPFLRDDWMNFMGFAMKQRKRDFKAGKSQGASDEYQPLSFEEYIKVKCVK